MMADFTKSAPLAEKFGIGVGRIKGYQGSGSGIERSVLLIQLGII